MAQIQRWVLYLSLWHTKRQLGICYLTVDIIWLNLWWCEFTEFVIFLGECLQTHSCRHTFQSRRRNSLQTFQVWAMALLLYSRTPQAQNHTLSPSSPPPPSRPYITPSQLIPLWECVFFISTTNVPLSISTSTNCQLLCQDNNACYVNVQEVNLVP